MKLALTLSFLIFPSVALAASGDGALFITTGHISTRAHVHFIVENEQGQRTGQLLDGRQVAEIPGTLGNYGTESQHDDASGEPGYERVTFESSGLSPGKYKVQVLPTATTAYWLILTVRNDNLSHLDLRTWGYAIAGTTVTYEVDFQPTTSSPTPVAKIVSFDSLRRSIQVALQVGQIGDAAFVSRLDKMLLKAQSFAETTSAKKQAADRLDQFIHRLDSAFKKEPDPDDGDDPQDKKESSIINRFATMRARDSLSEDARILIRGIGETPKR